MRNEVTASRRGFLKSAAAFGAFNIVPSSVLAGATAPSNQLARAIIGCGCISKSGNHLPFTGSRLAGITDCYAPRAKATLERCVNKGWGKPRIYKDFLDILDDP